MSFYGFLILFMLWTISETKSSKGAVQFRITESEFNKVAGVLMQGSDSYNVNVGDGKPKGVLKGLSYELGELVEKSNREGVHVQIPDDGNMIATTSFTNIELTGKMKLTSLKDSKVVYDGDVNVTLGNVSLVSDGVVDPSNEVVPGDRLHIVNLDFLNCSANARTLSVAQDTLQSIAAHATKDDLKNIFQDAVCQIYKMQYSLGFGESRITFQIMDLAVVVGTEASDLQIRNKTIIITQKVKTTFSKDTMLPNKNVEMPPSFPPLDATKEPFEVFLHVDIFNEIFRELKQNLGIGSKTLTLDEVLPNLDGIAELDTEGTYMMLLFPMVSETYPDAVARMFVLDGDIYFTIENGSLKMHFDITAEMSVTLNCDKNRTYSAFNFTMNLFFPAQVGYNNKYLTMQLSGLSGNITILNSTVGHIVDRQFSSLLYAVPYYTSNGLKKLNEKIGGIDLADFLPEDIYANVKSISIKKDSVVIGGSLSLTDPQLPVLKNSEIQWVGKAEVENLFMLGFDHTSTDLKPEKEKNCKKPPHITASAHIVTYQAVLLCIMGMGACLY